MQDGDDDPVYQPRHLCHACQVTPCDPSKLMCLPCWHKVPKCLQAAVTRTMKARTSPRDAAWLAAARAAINFTRGLDPTGKPIK